MPSAAHSSNCRFLRAIKQAVRVLHADDAGGQRPSQHIAGDRADSDRADLALIAQRDHLGQLVVEADDLVAFWRPDPDPGRDAAGSPPVCGSRPKLLEVGFDCCPQLGGLLGRPQRNGAIRSVRRADLAHDDQVVGYGRQRLPGSFG